MNVGDIFLDEHEAEMVFDCKDPLLNNFDIDLETPKIFEDWRIQQNSQGNVVLNELLSSASNNGYEILKSLNVNTGVINFDVPFHRGSENLGLFLAFI